jgi:hypothetical protein
MLSTRRRHLKKDAEGRVIYERIEEAHLNDGVIENVVTESGMDEETRLRWVELWKEVADLELRAKTQGERNRILEKDVDRKALRDREHISLEKNRLKLLFLEIKETLGLKMSKLWLAYALAAHQMNKERVELEYKGQRLLLDKEKLEAHIGIAEFRALVEYMKAKDQWLHHEAMEALAEERLTLDEKIEALRLLLAHERLEHDKKVDLKKIAISEDAAEREWDRLRLDQQVEAVKLQLRAKADDRDERRFLHEVKLDRERLALAKEGEARLREALSWQKNKEAVELEIMGKRYELDASKFLWEQKMDTEKLRQGDEQLKIGWADINLRERALSQQERVEIARLKQEAERILLQAREVRRKEKLTDHTIDMELRKDDREERRLQEDIKYKDRKLQQLDRRLDQEDKRIAQGEQKIAIEDFRAKVDAIHKAHRLRQADKQLDQRDKEIAIQEFRAKTDAEHKSARIKQADRQLAQGDKRLELEESKTKAEIEHKKRSLEQEEKKFALECAKAKSHFHLEGAKHQETMRRNRKTEELREKEIALEAVKTFGEISKNQAIEHAQVATAQAQLAKAQTEHIKGAVEVIGEVRRLEEMRREQDRADRQQMIDEKHQKEELKLKERMAEMDFETRIREIERRRGKDQQIYAVQTLNALIKQKQIDNEYKIEAIKLRNDIIKAGFRAGTQIVTGVLKLLGSLAIGAGYVASSTISATGRIASSIIKRR